MSASAAGDIAPRHDWRQEVGDERPRLYRWRDDSGPVDLTAVDLFLQIVWPAGSIEMTSGVDAGLAKLNQASLTTRGCWRAQLSAVQMAALPTDWPARYVFWARRFGIWQPLFRGDLTAIRGGLHP